ncbi:MAG: phosphoglucosamine mutase [Candidatus Microthrix parvicella]|nr:phosphoglucosamine mutase [Candidatus Microthrix parvicella]
MSLRFGTDGVRGVANTELTPTYALALGSAVVDAFDADEVVIGVDTRQSGAMLAAAVSAGVASAGADAMELEVIPTPAVAREARVRGCPGVMVSASHNPFFDNGLKVFGPGGQKLSDAEQTRIETTIMTILTTGRGVRVFDTGETAEELPPPTGADVGRIQWEPQVSEDYVAELVRAGGGDGALDGMVAVLDAAHGAGSAVGPRALRRLGVELTVIGDLPNGININDGVGSTALGSLREAVLNTDGAVGFALDGDADRCLAVDEHGNNIDGDQIIAVCALELARTGKLDNSAVAVTVMSNLGFRQAMEAAGVGVVVTPVGDRFVVDAMAREGLVLGGEQSGHVIFADVATTGDGLLTAIRLLRVMANRRQMLHQLAADAMVRLPQQLRNVSLDVRPPDLLDRIGDAVDRAEARLGNEGRVLIRPSGTEPVVRVMVEAPTAELAAEVADELAAEVARAAAA